MNNHEVKLTQCGLSLKNPTYEKVNQTFIKNLIPVKIPFQLKAKKDYHLQKLYLFCFLPALNQLEINPEDLQFHIEKFLAVKSIWLNDEKLFQCSNCKSPNYIKDMLLPTSVTTWSWTKKNVFKIALKWQQQRDLSLGTLSLNNNIAWQYKNNNFVIPPAFILLFFTLIVITFSLGIIQLSLNVNKKSSFIFLTLLFTLVIAICWGVLQQKKILLVFEQKIINFGLLTLVSLISVEIIKLLNLSKISRYFLPLLLFATAINILWADVVYMWYAKYLFLITSIPIILLHLKAIKKNQNEKKLKILNTGFTLVIFLPFILIHDQTSLIFWGNLIIVFILLFWITLLFRQNYLRQVKTKQANILAKNFDIEVEKQARKLTETVDNIIEEVKQERGLGFIKNALTELEGVAHKIGFHKRLISEIIRISLHKKDFDRVLDYSQKILDQDPEHKPALVAKAKALQKMHHWEEALEIVEKLSKKENHLQATILAGQICLDLAKVHEAKKYLKKASELREGHPLVEKLRLEIKEQSI